MERSIPHIRDIMGYFSPLGSDALERDGDHLTQKMAKLDLFKSPGNDSAVSIDSSEDERHNNNNPTPISTKKEKKKKSKAQREEAGRNHVPRAEKQADKEFRHLERHLSMKKTIRKKMMRDLRQAFVEDPAEFRVADPASLPAHQKNNINLQSLSFANSAKSEPSFLDMLRDDDSGNGSPTREPRGGDHHRGESHHTDRMDNFTPTSKKGFWSFFRGKNKR